MPAICLYRSLLGFVVWSSPGVMLADSCLLSGDPGRRHSNKSRSACLGGPLGLVLWSIPLCAWHPTKQQILLDLATRKQKGMHVEINNPRESIPNTTKEIQIEQWRNLEDSNYLKCLKGHYPNNKLCLLYYCSGGISISKIHSSCKMQKHILGSPPNK